jgi:hypothetical protein
MKAVAFVPIKTGRRIVLVECTVVAAHAFGGVDVAGEVLNSTHDQTAMKMSTAKPNPPRHVPMASSHSLALMRFS